MSKQRSEGCLGPKTRHTPGPWIFREWCGTPKDTALARKHGMEPIALVMNGGERVVLSEASGRVCLVDSQVKVNRGTGHETVCPERDANAALIAAAPDMELVLSALRSSVCTIYEPTGELRFNGLMYSTRGGPENWTTLVDLMGRDRLRAAIAKATPTP